MRFILVSGKPLNETVVPHGPIVMNTKEGIRTVFEEYRSGTFLNHSND
ncbi:hypothetical protein GF407_05675 [candidate division KSB1 bacterium]|nr:hypothetical protein [candidate division KSB1 bacterium]